VCQPASVRFAPPTGLGSLAIAREDFNNTSAGDTLSARLVPQLLEFRAEPHRRSAGPVHSTALHEIWTESLDDSDATVMTAVP
jgi:hypothetical protein